MAAAEASSSTGVGTDHHRTLFDHSRYAINHATQQGWCEQGIVGDCTQPLPFPDNSFAAVFCNEVLEHLEHPAALTTELHRVSRNLVAVSTPLRNTPDDKQHVWSFDEQDITQLLQGEPQLTIVGSTIIATVTQP